MTVRLYTWVKPTGARRFHYFGAGERQSVCKRWRIEGDRLPQPPYVECCTRCLSWAVG